MESECKIDVNPISLSDMEVYWQDEVTLNLDAELMYIKSGQSEIKKYVEEVSKPEISVYTNEYAKPIVSKIVNELAQPLINEYTESSVKPDVAHYAAEQMSIYAKQAHNAADLAQAAEKNAVEQAENAKKSAQSAADEALSAENNQQVSRSIKQECEQLKADCKAIKATLTGVYKWCGSVAAYENLPVENVDVGDVYNVLSTDMNYAWTESGWDQLGSSLYNIGYGLTLSDNTVAVNQDLVAMLSKFQVVATLPDAPESNVFYFVKES